MPNIEIHGFYHEKEKAYWIRRLIFGLFKNQPYIKEMVVTIFYTEVEDWMANSQPFFRLINDRMEPGITEEIISILHEKFPEMDIEHILNQKFIPKKDSG